MAKGVDASRLAVVFAIRRGGRRERARRRRWRLLQAFETCGANVNPKHSVSQFQKDNARRSKSKTTSKIWLTSFFAAAVAAADSASAAAFASLSMVLLSM